MNCISLSPSFRVITWAFASTRIKCPSKVFPSCAAVIPVVRATMTRTIPHTPVHFHRFFIVLFPFIAERQPLFAQSLCQNDKCVGIDVCGVELAKCFGRARGSTLGRS